MSWGIHLMAISIELLKIFIFDIYLKITELRLQPHIPGANELIRGECIIQQPPRNYFVFFPNIHCYINILEPRQDGHHCGRQHFQMQFHKWKVFNFNKNSLNFVPEGPIDNKSSLVQIMAWHRTGDKPLPEPMMTQFNDTYMRHPTSMY